MRSSQLHKLNTHGSNSAGETKTILKSVTQHGTNVIPATVEVYGLGALGEDLEVDTDIGAGTVTSQYVVSASESASAMATGLAAIINGKADHTASANENVIVITKTTAGTVEVEATRLV